MFNFLTIKKKIKDLETVLYEDKTALNLLYIQAVSDLEKKWTIPISKEAHKQLNSLKEENSKKQVLIYNI